jgi:hypothetical protein
MLFVGDLSAGSLALDFTKQQVQVRGVPPGHQVVLFGVGIGMYSYTPLLTRYSTVQRDDDGDGAVQFRVRRLVARGVWVAVDYESGEYVIATPTGASAEALPVPPDMWRGRAHAALLTGSLDAVVVRPGVGAWTLRIVDGGPNDGDGRADRSVLLRLDRMLSLTGGSGGPPIVTPKDVIIAADPETLRVFVTKVD